VVCGRKKDSGLAGAHHASMLRLVRVQELVPVTVLYSVLALAPLFITGEKGGENKAIIRMRRS